MPPGDAPNRKLGPAIKRLRTAAGLSQEEVAERSDITLNSVGRIERSEVNPTWTTVLRLVEALELTLVELAQAVEDTEARSASSFRSETDLR